MLRKLILITGLLFATFVARAEEAARTVFVAGDVRISGTAIALGHAVSEGDEVTTGSDGYVYLKTVDNGFLILRPNSRARIVAYHVDRDNPANTRIKLELVNGVARSISGDAVKQARQNFRFNTPVAAIGVRGTDFTVFTDQETSRVAVISGGIVVSGFGGGCGPEGTGPCEGKTSKELFATQIGQLLQIRKGQPAPQILPSTGISPDVTAPPRNDEPVGKTAATTNSLPFSTAEVSLDPQKNLGLLARFQQVAPAPVTPVPTPTLPSTVISPVIPPVAPQVVPPIPETSKIVWGRWQAIVDQGPAIDLVKLLGEKNQLVALNSYFAVMRTKGDFEMPATGSAGFALKQSEAYVLDEATKKFSVAGLENGKLQVDFAKASFATSFDIVTAQKDRFSYRTTGDVSSDGKLLGGNQFIAPNNVSVTGALGDNGAVAAYIFQGRIDDRRLTTGITYWTK